MCCSTSFWFLLPVIIFENWHFLYSTTSIRGVSQCPGCCCCGVIGSLPLLVSLVLLLGALGWWVFLPHPGSPESHAPLLLGEERVGQELGASAVFGVFMFQGATVVDGVGG